MLVLAVGEPAVTEEVVWVAELAGLKVCNNARRWLEDCVDTVPLFIAQYSDAVGCAALSSDPRWRRVAVLTGCWSRSNGMIG